ncbi:hypothetical protein Mpsy_1943 [Methanolobus psychrophilus R15]|nr:hypothetical protein Mpsy_1943 [Methanolobus psychrophilus R15]
MKKVIIASVMLAVIMTAGCAGIGNSPSGTVEKFASEFKKGNYDTCYGLMSYTYKENTDLAAFVSTCKNVNPDKYEFIKVTKEYIDQDTAVVDILVNESTVSLEFSRETFIEISPKVKQTTKQIELVKQEDEWRITKFPYVLT